MKVRSRRKVSTQRKSEENSRTRQAAQTQTTPSVQSGDVALVRAAARTACIRILPSRLSEAELTCAVFGYGHTLPVDTQMTRTSMQAPRQMVNEHHKCPSRRCSVRYLQPKRADVSGKRGDRWWSLVGRDCSNNLPIKNYHAIVLSLGGLRTQPASGITQTTHRTAPGTRMQGLP